MNEMLNVPVAVSKYLTKCEIMVFHYLSHDWHCANDLEDKIYDGRAIGSNTMAVVVSRLKQKLTDTEFVLESSSRCKPRKWRIVGMTSAGA